MVPNEGNTHSFDVSLACEVGVERALLLGNIWFWVNQNTKKQSQKHFRNGRYWTYDTAKGLAEKYPYLHAKSIARWVADLESEKWIVTGRFNEKNIDKTTWYTIGERLAFFYNSSISQNEKSEGKQEETPFPQNEKSGINSISQNEKTSETPISQNEETGKSSNSQNEETDASISQNEPAISQNENSISQNEKSASIYKVTDINPTDINPDQNINKYPADENDFAYNSTKNETPPPPTPAPEIESTPDDEKKELEEFTQKLQTYRPLRESIAMLYKLNDDQITEYIKRFVIREWGADNLKGRSKREVIGHCQRWIANELRIEKDQAERRNGNPKNGQRSGSRIPVREEPTTDLRAGFNRRTRSDN